MAFEDKLRSALEDAVKFCNEGSTPDEAVCKSAAAHEFNSDQTDRLVETLNTAITINQYKQAADKTASFPLAHKDKVAAMMLDADKVLGKEEKTAEVNHIYFDYSKPAYDYIAHEDDVVEKAAENEEKTTGLSRDNLAYLLVNQMKLVKNAADFAANIAGMMKSDLVTQLYGLAETVKKGGVEKYARFKESANKDIVKELDKVLPAQFKEAKCKASLVDDSDLSDEIKTAEDMAETLSSMKDMRAQADSMHKQAEKMNSEITTAFIGEKEEGPSTFLSLFNEKKASMVGRLAFGKGLTTGTQGLVHSDAFDLDSALFDNQASENDETKRTTENVVRAMMLQDLMARDKIIAEADPDTVASIYQTLLHISPELANDKELTRSVLRQAVNSIAISPYDANTWTDLEKKQREAIKLTGRA